jgi:hypothetical protein
MRCVRLGMLAVLAFLLAFAQVSSSPLSQNTMGKIDPGHFGMIQDKLEYFDGTATSNNWSGYTVVGSTFQSAAGSWIVPAANCTGVIGNKFAGFWVGLDGYTSTTFEQIGTLTNCARTSPYYYAWYEFYPQPMAIITSVPIQPGDLMSASVVYNSFDTKFTLTIKDHTSGKFFSVAATVPGALRSSADWIAEAPCCTPSGGILPLTDFGTVTFGLDHTGVKDTNAATDTSIAAQIGSFPPANTIRITKTSSSSSQPTSTCSALSSNGTSFSCKWKGLGR